MLKPRDALGRPIDCFERVDAYFRNMRLYPGNLRMRVRFLDKIYAAALDGDYTAAEHEMVLRMLLEEAEAEEDASYRYVDLAYAHKVKKGLGSDAEVPVERAAETVMATEKLREIPEWMLEDLRERNMTRSLSFVEAMKSDEEALELYNVNISRDHFFHPDLPAAPRARDSREAGPQGGRP